MGNKASYIHLRGSDLRPQFHQFTAVVSHLRGPLLSLAWAWGGLLSASGAVKLPHFCLPCALVPQPHPDVKPMAYASTLLQLGMM